MAAEDREPRIMRSRISHELAFPIGYEWLRAHFSTALPWTAVRFYFSAHPTTSALEFTRLLQRGAPYQLVRLEHRASLRGAPLWFQESPWAFHVYPVNRKLKSAARASLLREVVNSLTDFAARAPTHIDCYNRMDAIFDPADLSCRTELFRPL